MDTLTLQIIAIVFLATVVRSTFGFGEAMVAVPLLSMKLPLTVAAPLAVLLSVAIAGLVLVHDWRHIQVRSATGLLLASLVGIPIGVYLLKRADENIIKTALGAILIAFSVYALFKETLPHLEHDEPRLLLAFGFVSGVLGGAYGMNGPPLIVYGALRRWSPLHFRSTLQAYFLPASMVGMAGYLVAGLWTMQVTRYFLLSLPATVAATYLGNMINRRLQGQSFLRYVYMALIVIGAALIFRSFWK